MTLGHLPAADAALLRRWLTALGLLASAEELVRRGDDAACSTSLIAADSACEAVLGILGTWSALSLKQEPTYNGLMGRAIDAASQAGSSLNVGLLADLRTTRATRNTAMHHGATATAAQAALACQCARRLLDVLPAVSTRFGALQPGAGIVTAIASLINAPDLAEQFALGERALAAGEAVEAADAASRAHSALLYRLDPPMGREHPGPLSPFDLRELGRGRRYIEGLGESVVELQGWVNASALGLEPVKYRKLRKTLGLHLQFAGGTDAIRREQVPTLEASRLALVTVAEMAFRLWQLGGLLEGTQKEVIQSRYGNRS
jgi:hypothetical protein